MLTRVKKGEEFENNDHFKFKCQERPHKIYLTQQGINFCKNYCQYIFKTIYLRWAVIIAKITALRYTLVGHKFLQKLLP